MPGPHAHPCYEFCNSTSSLLGPWAGLGVRSGRGGAALGHPGARPAAIRPPLGSPPSLLILLAVAAGPTAWLTATTAVQSAVAERSLLPSSTGYTWETLSHTEVSAAGAAAPPAGPPQAPRASGGGVDADAVLTTTPVVRVEGRGVGERLSSRSASRSGAGGRGCLATAAVVDFRACAVQTSTVDMQPFPGVPRVAAASPGGRSGAGVGACGHSFRGSRWMHCVHACVNHPCLG